MGKDSAFAMRKKQPKETEHPPEDANISVDVKANRYTLRCLNYAIAATVFVWVLNVLNVFIVEQHLMLTATVLALVLLALPKAVCCFAGVEAGWVKYIILLCTTTAIAVYGVALSYHVVLLFTLPLFFAAQYQSRRVMAITYGVVLAGLLISVICSFRLGLCDMNMLLLSAHPTAHYADLSTGELFNLSLNPDPQLTIPLYFFVPRAIMLLVFIPVLIHLVDMSAENAVVMNRLRQLSETDRSTRFYNKNKYDQMVSGHYPGVDRVGVIFWDLNNLKSVNDNYGHSQGDRIIAALAGCIFDLVDSRKNVYRIGGDEFVMILEDPGPDEMDNIMRQVQERVDQHNAASRIPVSTAVGYATGAGASIASVIEEADRNMYADKNLRQTEEIPKNMRDTILNDRLFEGLANVSDNVYIYLNDMRTSISRWSPNAVEYFDMPGEFMSNAGDIWASRIHPEDLKTYMDDIGRIFSGQSVYHKCEYRAMNRYGEYVWLECRGNVIYDEIRQTRYFSGIMLRLDNRNKYDPLTKLKTLHEFNNVSFEGRTGSLLLFGLDDFRMVVNNFGYAYGDLVLAEFAQRVIRFCGEAHVPYRMEGDEFLILTPGAGAEETVQLFNELRSLGYGLGKEGGRLVNIHFSGGAALFPKNGTHREELIGNLEHSLELAKSQHRGELVFFEDDIALVHQQTQIIKECVTRAVQENYRGFSLYFQPLVSSADHRIVSCEALLRYEDFAERGIQIGDMVSFLEKNGDIIPVGRWVAEQVFRKAEVWQKQYPDLSIGFNVSAVQFQDPEFVDYIIRLGKERHVDPSRITVEITESSEMEDYFSAAQYLRRLRDHGYKVALDDFGIAYSTLMLIKTLPTDFVKIDHSFVLHLHQDTSHTDLMIVESVIELCRKLGIQVVAEGVENAEILKILEQYPIALFQGYYFSRPLPEEDFVKRLLAEKMKTEAAEH